MFCFMNGVVLGIKSSYFGLTVYIKPNIRWPHVASWLPDKFILSLNTAVLPQEEKVLFGFPLNYGRKREGNHIFLHPEDIQMISEFLF